MAAPVSCNDNERKEILRRYEILDTPAEEGFDDICRMASTLSDAPIALICLVDGERYWFKSRVGVEVQEINSGPTFCTVAIQKEHGMVVEDALLDPRFASLPVVTGPPHIRFYAGMALISPEGVALGTLCVMDTAPRPFDNERLEILKFLARQVMTHLEVRRVVNVLAETAIEHKNAETALRESEVFFHSLVESLPQHIIRKDTHERFTFANERFCRLVGLSLSELVGKTDFDLYPPELAAKYQQDDQMVMQHLQAFDTIEENRSPDGSPRYMHVIKVPLLDSKGQILGIQGIFWDETERKSMEEALAYERELLRALMENIPDQIYFKDIQSRFLRCSSAMIQRLGLKSASEVVGKTDFDFNPKELAEEYFADEKRILRTGQALVNKTEKFIDADEHELWCSATKVPIYTPAGQITGLVGISRDITPMIQIENAMRQAEERYREIFERAVEGIYQTTPDGRFLNANPALARMYGFTSAEDLITRTTDIGQQYYVDPKRREEYVRQINEVGQATAFESEVYRRDGQAIWISENARAVRDVTGKIVYFEGTVEEITARKQAEKERERAREAAMESARLKSQFLANVSHEIRTPLNGIVGMTGLLLDSPLKEEQRGFATTIRTSADALLEIINDLLDFSKIEAGKLTFDENAFDLRDIVETTVELLGERAQRKRIELASWVDSELPKYVTGDSGRARQVLLNLVGNAVKFTEHGEVLVRVTQEAETVEQVVVRFTVKDTGIGISPNAMPLIFQAFVQGDGSTTRRYGGTGLGLAISKQLVELMHGHLGVESEPGVGSTFWFTLPFAKTTEAPAPTAPSSKRDSLAGLRVLVVDDNETNRQILAHQFSAWKMNAALAASGSEALKLLQEMPPSKPAYDLLILDMQMPEMDGLTLAQIVRKNDLMRNVPIIILTSMGSQLEDDILRKTNIAACLNKPIKQSRLFDCLAHVLQVDPILPDAPLYASIPAPPPAPITIPMDARRVRILLAEDNIVNQRVVLFMLQKLGMHADAVSNGKEVLDALSRAPYDLLLLDCHMPEMDGYETSLTIQRCRQDPAQSGILKSYPRIIALTANALKGDREKCLAAGMDDYLSKPIDPSAFVAALQRAGIQTRLPSSAAPPTPPPLSDQELPERLDIAVLERWRGNAEPGEPDPLTELIELFIQDMQPLIEGMQKAIDASDAVRLKSPAHSLKGSASNMGVRRLSRFCAEMEKKAKEANLDGAQELLAQIKSEFTEVKILLEAYIKH